MHPRTASARTARTRARIRAARTRGALAACAALALAAGCQGTADGGGSGASASASRGASAGDGDPVATPGPSRAPARGKGSKDPDDVNGDGHRDLLLPVRGETEGAPVRLAVVFGSAKGLDPDTRAVYTPADLGVPVDRADSGGGATSPLPGVVTADLDGDGYPDLVLPYNQKLTDEREMQKAGNTTRRTSLRVAWGGPAGPQRGRKATPLRVPQADADRGLDRVVRGDFDGDGRLDLAAMRGDNSTVTLLYGPFSRSGAPARTATRPGTEGGPGAYGELIADDVDPSGRPRATGLVVHLLGDGEQTDSVLYPARTGSGPADSGRKIRKGSALAFGDFDGDGLRDLAAGDSGSRNDEPGYETEAPEVDGSLTVYPGKGGSTWDARLPKRRDPVSTSGAFYAADPDGDGRDAVLVATDAGALLIDGDRRTTVTRRGPARFDGQKVRDTARPARASGAADFDGDGKDELILNWAGQDRDFATDPQLLRTLWWITDGTTSGNRTAFTTTPFTEGD